MNTKRFLQHLHLAEQALWDDNREVFEGIAHEVAGRYGLAVDDAELVVVAVRERLWEKLLHIGRARHPAQVARCVAYQAAAHAACELLPEGERIRLLDRKRAKRRKSQSSDRPNAQN